MMFLLLISCEEEASNSLNLTEESRGEIKESEVIYSIPSPSNFYEILAIVDKKVSDVTTNPTENASEYVTHYAKSINFGVYCSDLAFLAHFNHNEKILAYYRTLKSLGNDLEVAAVFSMGGLDALEDDVENSDSILKLASKTYEDAYQYLELKGRGEDLALMMAGGWLEGACLVSGLVKNYDEDFQLIERLYEEQFSLESIILNLEQYTGPEIEELRKELQVILDFFIKIDQKLKKDSNELAGGNQQSLTKEEFLELKSLIMTLRNKQINTK